MGKILVVFGLPGAGKSFVADVIKKKFGYTIHDGDDDIPKDMREALFRKRIISDAMRQKFLDNMITSVTELSKKNKKLVVHQTFLKEFMRKKFLETFPDAQFLLVQTNDDIREERYVTRDYFNLGLTYLRHMCELFEKITIPHEVIKNNTDGESEVVKELTLDNL